MSLTIQVAPDDCTGCGVCVDVCPAQDKTEVKHKSINMRPIAEHLERERVALGRVPRRDRTEADRRCWDPASVKSQPAARAAVRVLRRVRGLRRDAVPQAAHPAVRRPPPDRQRHRLLVDLRRQPADDAVGHRRATVAARRGPTPCSRTTPSSVSASASGSTRSGTPHVELLAELAPHVRGELVEPRPGRAISRRRRGSRRARPRSRAHATRLARLHAGAARRRSARAARLLLELDRRARAQERVDRRRRRLGVRHRRRRPRPCARQRAQRQRARARHRGVLEHRRAGVEGDAARRRGEVRGRRQAHRQEGPRRSRP